MAVGRHPTPGASASGANARLPWWALALPTLAFVALLVLLLGGSDTREQTQPVVQLLQLVGRSALLPAF